ncbi:MAG: type VI secretion system protein ImpL [Planctomycetia bacterium]|nr:type VI secretion system protein ImpL [Planctomycetia bacterium]
MKDLFLKFLKIFLIIAIVILIALFAFGLVLSLDWPWWAGFFILLGIIGICIGGFFLRKIWYRYREKKFVQQVIDQDEHRLSTLKGKEREELRELQNKWKEGVEALKRSHLRKFGNPLYVLPWYVILGESGTGKTTAISSAKLPSSFAEISKVSGISGTRNCDWWFFEQAIILDTAGRWSIHIDEGRDKEEWQKFLTLLTKYRKREPINGIIVSVAANKLLEASPEALAEDGRNIRCRIDELMGVLGFKFPVYVLVTKCDLIQGMTRFCDRLPEKGLDQPMGVINQALSTDTVTFQEQAINTIGERLRSLRLLFLQQPESEEADPGILLFPEEFKNLKRGLGVFMKEAFLGNPYQETSILRGLFFSSGRQEGRPFSHFLNALGLIGEKEVLPGTSKGLFLHDFFSRILPIDRRLFAPTRRTIEWGKLTRNLGLTSWFVVCVAMCGMLSFSFVKNLKIIREVPNEFSKATVLNGEIVDDVVTMDRFREIILNTEAQNRAWWIPRFGMNESNNVEMQLKDKYGKKFRDRFLVLFDKSMVSKMTNFSGDTTQEVFGQYINHLVKRINLLQARFAGENLQRLRARPQPFRDTSIFIEDKEPVSKIRERFADLYLYHLVWWHDTNVLNMEMNDLQKWLKHILSTRKINFDWLIAWVNTDPSLSLHEVSLANFWGGNQSASSETVIPPAFTLEGKVQIDAFLAEIESALPDPLIIASQKSEFQELYRQAYMEKWYDFGNNFSKGIERLTGKEKWQEVLAGIVKNQGPYFLLLDRMVKELQPFTSDADLPEWIKHVYALNNARFQEKKLEMDSGKEVLLTAAKKGKELLGKIGQKTGLAVGGKNLETQLKTENAFRDYLNALTAIAPVSSSRTVAFQMAAQAFSEDPATGKSTFWIAQNAVNSLKAVMGGTSSDLQMFWQLVTGPLEFLKMYTIRETSCYLQKLWEKEVIMELGEISNKKDITMFLLSPDGFVMNFINEPKGPAAPFLDRDPNKGYYAKRVLGEKVPFEEPFLTFITGGYKTARSIKKNYEVIIDALPTDTNSDASKKPHCTKLELKCSGSIQNLVNRNYPVKQTFSWAPDTCGDVLLQIEIADKILTKQYEGPQAFPIFLRDFSGGQHTFSPKDFSGEQQSFLGRLGVKYIKVNYEFHGHQVLLDHFDSLPKTVPENIVTCWDR